MRLLDPQVRADPVQVEALLHPDFREIGAGGQVWDREAIVAELASAPAGRVDVVGLAGREVAPNVILLLYATEDSRRSSLWVRGQDEQWRVLYHQGTPAPPPPGR